MPVDPRALLDFLDAQRDQQMHSLAVLQHGELLASGWWAPRLPSDQQLVYSLSKTFTSAAVGLCVADGHFGYDDTIAELLPDLADGATAATRRIRVRDCLAMATGHTSDLIEVLELPGGRLDEAAVRGMLATEPQGTPGETFCYNQLASYTCSVLVQRYTGDDVLALLRRRVLDWLGAPRLAWIRDADGRCQGFSGLHVDTGTLACFFQLLLDGGVHRGHRLLPRQWIEQYCQVQVQTAPGDADPASDWAQGYGWQCWLSREGHRGDGAFGQYGLVLPEHDAVVVLTGEVLDMQVTLDHVWRHLVPGLGRTGSAADQAALEQRLAQLSLPVVDDDTPPPAAPPAGERLEASFELQESDGDAWLLCHDGGGEQQIPLGFGSWRRHELVWRDGSLRVATSASRRGDQVLAHVLVLDTPHTVEVLAGTDQEAQARWRITPLGLPRSLHQLRRRQDWQEPA